ncbi:hypothetical protein [Kitasatospora purpeofusca]|uniref:Uncharacterized protein n=1 Tax=Kitasatospora purpeofusca TaxID=67352 RepID=A0ABZ1UC69_9ACTN|nr:hypothetical protein [Kitasatospora purpeofusca]
MALSPSLASRSAVEAPRPETARTVNGAGDPEGADEVAAAGGVGPADGGEGPERAGSGADQAGGRRSTRREAGAAGASVPAPAQPGGRTSAPAPRQHAGAVEDQTGAAGRPRPRGRAPRRPTGRERHDEKITVYVSAEELMDLEHTRLVLRGEHGLAVDRGRIVREAIAVVLADLEQRGEASILVRRLRGR